MKIRINLNAFWGEKPIAFSLAQVVADNVYENKAFYQISWIYSETIGPLFISPYLCGKPLLYSTPAVGARRLMPPVVTIKMSVETFAAASCRPSLSETLA